MIINYYFQIYKRLIINLPLLVNIPVVMAWVIVSNNSTKNLRKIVHQFTPSVMIFDGMTIPRAAMCDCFHFLYSCTQVSSSCQVTALLQVECLLLSQSYSCQYSIEQDFRWRPRLAWSNLDLRTLYLSWLPRIPSVLCAFIFTVSRLILIIIWMIVAVTSRQMCESSRGLVHCLQPVMISAWSMKQLKGLY